MKNRLSLIITLCLLFFIIFSSFQGIAFALNNKNKKTYTIFIVLWRGVTDAETGFMDYLKQQKIPVKFIIRDCKKDRAKLPEIISEIRSIKPDLVYTFGTTVSTTIAGTLDQFKNEPEKCIKDIPIVFNIVADPVGAKLVPDLISSGRNITGASHLVPVKACVNALMSVGNFKKIGIIFNPSEKNSVLRVQKLEKLSKKVNFKLIKGKIPLDKNGKPHEESIPNTVSILASKKPDLIYIPSESFLISKSQILVDAINAYKIPSFSETEGPIRKSGALMGLVSRYYNVGQFVGYKAKQILIDKRHPKDIPIETLKRFSFLFDIETAKKLKCYPPLHVLKFAEIIKRKKK